MVALQDSKLRISVQLEHDGTYWVATAPALGLVAAHQKQDIAWVRVCRMVYSQISYAFTNDPALGSLFPTGEEEVADRLKALRRENRPILLEIEDTESKATVEIPGVCC